jgi:site-specific DNA recombinase
VINYARKSPDPKAKEAEGVGNQHELNRAMAKRLGCHIVATLTDDSLSASEFATEPRPDFDTALAMLRNGEAQGILAYSQERLTRTPEEWFAFARLAKQLGIKVAFHNRGGWIDLESATGQMTSGLFGLLSAYETSLMSERIKVALEGRRNRGLPAPAGTRSFGFKPAYEMVKGERTKVREICAALESREATAIRDAADWILSEGASITEVINRWTAAGVKPLRAQRWSAAAVNHILKSPRIAGLVEYKGEVVGKGSFPAILPEEKWRAMVDVMEGRGSPKGRGHAARKHLLSGFVFCAECGQGMDAQVYYLDKAKGQRDDRRSRYVCVKTRGGCGRTARNMAWIEAIIDSLIRKALAEMSDQDEALEEPADSSAEEIKRLEGLIKDAKIRFKAGTVAPEDFYPLQSELRDEINLIKREQARRVRQEAARVPLADDALAVWQDRSPESLNARRAILASAVDRIMVKHLGRNGWGARKGIPLDSIEIIPVT